MKKTLIIIGSILIVGTVAIFIIRGAGQSVPDHKYIEAELGDVAQEVSVSGTVASVQERKLAFERGGTVRAVLVEVGEVVSQGDPLVRLDSSELAASLARSRAALEAEEIKLSELTKGTRVEELALVETKLANAERAVLEAQSTLSSVQAKALADLTQAEDAALSAAKNAILTAKLSLVTLSDLQETYYNSDNQDAYLIQEMKEVAVLRLFGVPDAGDWIPAYISNLSGGLYGDVQAASLGVEGDDTGDLVTDTLQALYGTRDALNAFPITDAISATDKTSLQSAKTSIATDITAISSRLQALNVQRAANESALVAAGSALTTAENARASAIDELTLAQSGASSDQIEAQRSRVTAGEADVSLIEAQLAKTVLRAPITGTVTEQRARVGATVGAFETIATIETAGDLEILAPVTEADIVKVTVGDIARITLDAFGDDVLFEATVSEIDPAERLIEGVATYQVTLGFIGEHDGVKPGMTANIDILTASRQDVIAVPARALLTGDQGKYVRVLRADNSVDEVPVKVGLRGSDGRVELTDGVAVGDKVITLFAD